MVLRSLSDSERAPMHQTARELGLQHESTDDGWTRCLVIGSSRNRDLEEMISEIDAMNGFQKYPMHMFPVVARYYRTSGRAYLIGRDIMD